MVISKKRSKQIIIVGIILTACISSKSQDIPKINIDVVKNDLKRDSQNVVPIRFIDKSKEPLFSIIYQKDLCFVHLSYKDYFSECNMKTSVLAIYRFVDSKWLLKIVRPYYYNFSVLYSQDFIFLSENEFCEPDGDCKIFIELSQFNSTTNEISSLVSFSGYDKFKYYDRLLNLGEITEVRRAIGDTIVNSVKLLDFNLNGKNKSFVESRRLKILTGIQDSLLVRENDLRRLTRIPPKGNN